MKKIRFFRFCFLWLLGSFCKHGLSQPCDQKSINLGTISAQWVYRNPDLPINFPLPAGWFVYDYVASPKRYLRIGSDYMKMSMGLSDMSGGSSLDIVQLKNFPVQYAPILLSIAKLPDTTNMVLSAEDLVQNHTLSFRIYDAENMDAPGFLAAFYKKWTGKTIDTLQIKDMQIGSIDFKSVLIPGASKTDPAAKTLLAVKNFGCVQLLARIVYDSAGDLSEIMDACKQAGTNP
jgi:hypothetical protein